MNKALLIIAAIFIVITGGTGGNEEISKPKQLSQGDFIVNFNGFEFDDNYPIDDLIKQLGMCEEDQNNNYGLVSQGLENGYGRWMLHYPERDNMQMRLAIMGDGLGPSEGDYIAEVTLWSGETSRGIKVGDSSEKVVESYGDPNKLAEGGGFTDRYIYFLGSKKLIFEIEKDNKVVSITYDYNYAKSVEDQGFK